MKLAPLALITGASRGIGRALARTLLDRGWRVAGFARGAMDDLAGEGFSAHPVDLADTAAAVTALERCLDRTLTAPCEACVLINNAGTVQPVAPVGRLDAAAIAAATALNLATPIALADAFLRRTAGTDSDRRIASISSGAARSAYAGWGVYCATKAGLDHFSRCAALEQAGQPNPARIAAIAPGVVDTAMQDELRACAEADFPTRQRFVDLKQEGGLAAPEAVAARLVDYLLSPAFGDPPVVDLRTL